MNYNDFNILTDNEYMKLAEQYKSASLSSASELINNAFNLLEECKNSLCFNTPYTNYKIKNELTNHYKTLCKLSTNIKLTFNTKENNAKNFDNFNLFNYISNLIIIQNYLNKWMELENKSKNLFVILKIKNELNNNIISLLNVLSKLNIHIFKFM